jgi:hypothetical protein
MKQLRDALSITYVNTIRPVDTMLRSRISIVENVPSRGFLERKPGFTVVECSPRVTASHSNRSARMRRQLCLVCLVCLVCLGTSDRCRSASAATGAVRAYRSTSHGNTARGLAIVPLMRQ